MKADYVHKDSRTLEEKPQVFTRWIDPTIEELKQQCKKQKEVIDKAIEYIKHYETIRGYYEYEECGYDEYNYEENLKEELLDILKEIGGCL